MFIRDVSIEDSEICLLNFLFEINAGNIVNNYTCYKSIENSSFMDPVIRNSPLSFQNMVTITTDLSQFHKILISVLEKHFQNLLLRKSYADYKNFNRDKLKIELKGKINKNSNLIGEYDFFEKMSLLVLKLGVCYFLTISYFLPDDCPSKTMMKDVFILSKKLFSFLRYSTFCVSIFFAFSLCQPLL